MSICQSQPFNQPQVLPRVKVISIQVQNALKSLPSCFVLLQLMKQKQTIPIVSLTVSWYALNSLFKMHGGSPVVMATCGQKHRVFKVSIRHVHKRVWIHQCKLVQALGLVKVAIDFLCSYGSVHRMIKDVFGGGHQCQSIPDGRHVWQVMTRCKPQM